MRISVIKEDRGYTGLEHLFAVVFDGVLATAVITADEDAGTLTRYVTDKAGNIIRTGDASGFKTERLAGTVTIGFHPKVPLLDEDKALSIAAFVKKYSTVAKYARQRDADRIESGRLALH